MFQAVFPRFAPSLGIRSEQEGRGRAPKGSAHNLLLQFVILRSSKFEVFQTGFYHIVVT